MALSIQHYRSILVEYLLPQRMRMLVLAALMLATAGLQLLSPTILRSFIDTTIAAVGRPDANTVLPKLTGLALLFLALNLVTQLLVVLSTYLSSLIGWTSTNRLRSDLARHCLSLDLPFHSQHTPGEMIERIDGDVNTLSQFFAQFTVQIGGSVLLLVGVLAMLWWENMLVGAVMSLFALLTLLALLRLRSLAVPSMTADRAAQAALFGTIEERLAGLDDIRANGAGSYVMLRLSLAMREVVRRGLQAVLMLTTVWGLTVTLFAVGYALVLGMGIFLYGRGTITLGTVYLFFQYTNLLRHPLEMISEQLRVFQQAGAGLVRIEQLRSLQSTISDGVGLSLPEGSLGLRFERVHFSYENLPTISDLSFELAPGEVLGLIGRTGSGKSTLTRLLLRLYECQRGAIYLNGVDLRDLKLQELRRRIGIVTQDVQLFAASVRANITLFDAQIEDERILAALAELDLLPWLERQPQGLDTPIGPGMLSAGEAQLLALARIFLRNPDLIILDEASSRLDPATEYLLEHALQRLLRPKDRPPRTAIIIAHRLQTVQRADLILLLEKGHMLEWGRRYVLAATPKSHFAELLRIGMEDVLA